jgi:glycosyltransferase involved in cell wall biosynthesis
VALDFLGPVDPSYATWLRERASSVDGLEVSFYGPFANDTLPALLGPVDAVAIASTVPESFSIAAHEAFACGKPVIAAAAGALVEVVRDGENGLWHTSVSVWGAWLAARRPRPSRRSKRAWRRSQRSSRQPWRELDAGWRRTTMLRCVPLTAGWR